MSNFLTQSELAQRLMNKASVSPETAKAFSTVFFKIVKKGLKNSDRFAVYNFGTFKKTWIEATTGLNPSSGEKINIPAHWRIKFVPCASVAKRINRPFAHLKPKPIEDMKIGPNGLYAKAEKYANMSDEPEPEQKIGLGLLAVADKIHSELPTVVEDSNDQIIEEDEMFEDKTPDMESHISDRDDINDDEEELEESKGKTGKIAAIAGLSGIFLILLLSLLVKNCSSKPKSKKIPEAKKVEPETEIQQIEEKTVTEENEQFDEIEAEILFESYLVPTGKNYHTIAEEKLGNRHLWPLLYSANKKNSSDPDFVPSYRTIQIPENFDAYSSTQLAEAFLDAYNGYLLMIEKQPDSSKNKERELRAIRVIVSAELVSPGFIETNRNRILPEYSQRAINIVNHQYKR